jgi:hypothetical protein
MAGPFFNNIKGTTAGAAGTGAYTPNAASAGALAWSTVPAGWMGLVRFDDGSANELQYSYWNGTTLSRAATTQFVSGSTGSALTLTSAATAEMSIDGADVAPHLVIPFRMWLGTYGGSFGVNTIGTGNPTVTGTQAAGTLATTNALTEQIRFLSTSATTANAQSAISTTSPFFVVNTTAGRGGGEIAFRFGCSALPTGPRVFMGMTATTMVGVTTEPSALTANYAVLGKDSTDTNLQFLVNSNVSTGTKIDTGIALVANGVYECTIWFDPGGNTMKMLLLRLDTGAIYYGSTVTDVPATGALLAPEIICGLSSATGTAIVLNFCQAVFRTGAG